MATNPDVGFSGTDLRSDALESAHATAAYLHYDVFHYLDVYPFSLTQGNIENNVDALQAVDPSVKPLDLLTLQIKRCVDFGLPREQLWRDALEPIEVVHSADDNAALVAGSPQRGGEQ